MSAAILEHLELLYGESAASALYARLHELIARHKHKTGARAHERTSLPVTERDVLLITYGDQLHEPEKPPLKSLGEFAEKYVRGVLSGIHILPFYPYSSADGFSVIDYLQVDPALGSWGDIATLRRDLDLMFDAIFNHVSAQSEWFRKFLKDDSVYRKFFITVGEELLPRVHPQAHPLLTRFKTAAGEKKVWTTFNADQVDLNFENPVVLLVVLDILLFYVERGARFLRLDAVAYLWKEMATSWMHHPQTHRIIQLMRAVLDEVAPEVMLVTETNVAHADNLSYFGDGTNEAQLICNFALPPLVLHSFHTANTSKLAAWARSLKLPSNQVTFFNFLASHEGIGLSAARDLLDESEIKGLVERAEAHGGFITYGHNVDGFRSPSELNINFFDALSNPTDTGESIFTQARRFIAAHAIMLSMAGVPGIYFHSLFGSRGDIAAAVTSGIPRRINRQKLKRASLENELENPLSLRSQVYFLFTELLRKRRSHPAFHPCGRQRVLSCDDRVFALHRFSPDGERQALCLHNVSNQPVQLTIHLADDELGGSGREPLIPGRKLSVRLPPYEVHWIMD